MQSIADNRYTKTIGQFNRLGLVNYYDIIFLEYEALATVFGKTSNRIGTCRFFFEKLGMTVDLTGCKSSDFPTAAVRPLNSCFNCSKIEALLGEPIRNWQGPLEHFLEQL